MARRVRLGGDSPSRLVSSLREIGPWISTARARALSLSLSMRSTGSLVPSWHERRVGTGRISVIRDVLCGLVSSVLELTHALPRRGDDRPHRHRAPARRGGTGAAPAPRRHQRRGRPRRRPAPGDRALGRGARPARATQTLRSLAVAARPQRVSGGLDEPARATLVATPAGGWLGTPGLEGHRDGASFSVRLELVDVQADDHRALLSLVDREARLSAQLELRVGTAGLLHQRITLRNDGDSRYTVQHLHLAFPVPWDATEILDTTGRHLRERVAAAAPLRVRDVPAREPPRPARARTPPSLLAAGRPGFGFERGRVHAVHVAWSGNHRLVAERSVSGEAFLAGGELFAPGEVVLAPGASITSPEVIGSWGDGLSELAHRFHDEWRRRPAHPRRPRPITLNTWEAVYFDHSLERLTALADAAASVGVERFVLDDGWFAGRRDDTAGPGRLVRRRDGLARRAAPARGPRPATAAWSSGCGWSPRWSTPTATSRGSTRTGSCAARMALPPSARQQQVLDLAHPDAYAYIAERLHACSTSTRSRT